MAWPADNRLLDGRALACGIEREENAYLTASNANVGTIIEKLTDSLKGVTIGAQPRAQPARERAEDCGDRIARQVRRRCRPQPEDRSGLRDGIDAELQPEQDRVAGTASRASSTRPTPVPARRRRC